MLLSDIPSWFAKRFAADATGTHIRPIPATSADPAAASMSLGFPPQTFVDEGAGGTPPNGRDVNGVLNFLAGWAQWQGAGAAVPFNATIASNGGYPKGARVMSSTLPGLTYVNLVDSNTTNPDSGGANWTFEGDAGHDWTPAGGHITLGGYTLNFGTTTVTDASGVKVVFFDKPFVNLVLLTGATNVSGALPPAAWSGTGNASLIGMTVGMAIAPAGGGAGVPATIGTASNWWALGV